MPTNQITVHSYYGSVIVAVAPETLVMFVDGVITIVIPVAPETTLFVSDALFNCTTPALFTFEANYGAGDSIIANFGFDSPGVTMIKDLKTGVVIKGGAGGAALRLRVTAPAAAVADVTLRGYTES